MMFQGLVDLIVKALSGNELPTKFIDLTISSVIPLDRRLLWWQPSEIDVEEIQDSIIGLGDLENLVGYKGRATIFDI